MVRYTLALFLASLATGAHADVVCRSRSGALSLRKTCHKRQMLVPPSSLGIMGGLVVKDSKGALVGFVIGSTFTHEMKKLRSSYALPRNVKAWSVSPNAA